MKCYNLKKNECYIKFLIISILFYTYLTSDALAIGNQLNFERITNEDGLSQNTIRSVIQDKKGYMWIGTNEGLNIYDGNKFEIVKYNKFKDKGLSSSNILCITQDNKENIWIGTKNGLNRFDTKTNKVQIYKSNDCDENSISNNSIRALMVDSKNRLWVGTEYGLNIYNYDDDNFLRLCKSDSDIKLTDNRITAIEEDNKGNIWVGTKDGLNCINKDLSNIDTCFQGGNSYNLTDNSITSLCVENDNLWVGTLKGGINKLNLKTKENIIYNNEKKEILSNTITKLKIVNCNEENKMFIGTHNGLNIYDLKTEKIIECKNSTCDLKSLSSNVVIDIYQDRTGLIWIGTADGMNLYNSKSFFKQYKKTEDENSISSNIISGIYEDNDELLWVGTMNNGINCIDRKNRNQVIYKEDKNEYVWSVVGNENDEIYWNTSHYIKKFDKSNGTSTTLDLPIFSPRILYFDKEGYLWIGGRNELIAISPDGEVIDYKFILESTIGKLDKVILTIHQDKNGEMWFGGNIGLVRYNKETNKIKNYYYEENTCDGLISNRISCINSDSKGTILIGSDYGINMLDPKTEKFTQGDESSGLPSNYVYGILVDEKDNPWISTNQGICKLEIDNQSIIIFDIFDGLQGKEFNLLSYFKNKNGEMFFGGNNGFNVFSPSKFKEEDISTDVVIKDISINDKEIVDYEDLSLKHYENSFSINFFLPDYRNLGNRAFLYRLKGLDKEWNFGLNLNNISYTQIPPGDYTFEICSQNCIGQWSSPKKVNINIQTPPWRTPFAYLIYIIIVSMIILFLWNEFKVLESLVKQKTSELNKELHENENLYKKIIKQEKNKNNYFVNLSHELRTPLNVILSSLQLIDKLNEEKSCIPKEKIVYYVKVMNKNSNRLLKLINNIIDTSKIESGTYEVKFENVDIVYLVEEVALSMKDLIENKGIELIIDPEMEEKMIECAPVEIERCIINLIGNAVKFTDKGGKIEVKLFDLGQQVKISVKDTGIGIDCKYHDVIFNRFSQAYKKSTEEYGGSGLGLTVTRQLILLHEGDIELISKVGEGSEFVITLPVYRNTHVESLNYS
ncbi:two-component regulator propeller domain-containing protein [Clostridium sp. CTA-19]